MIRFFRLLAYLTTIVWMAAATMALIAVIRGDSINPNNAYAIWGLATACIFAVASRRTKKERDETRRT